MMQRISVLYLNMRALLPCLLRLATKLKSSLYLLIIMFFSVLQSANAEEGHIQVRNLSLADGLSQTTITAITQDPTGFMWFGTQDGLNRYDGKKFKIYKPENNVDDSISSNSVWALLVDKQGVLWVGTYLGVNRYDSLKDSFVSYQFDENNLKSISHNDVRALYEDSQGNFWVGTKGGGLNLMNRKDGTFVAYRHRPGDDKSLSNDLINRIHEDKFGNLWIATDRGLNRFDRQTQEFSRLALNKDIGNAVVLSIESDEQGLLWIGTDTKGVFAYNVEKNTIVQHKHDEKDINSISGDQITALFLDSKKRLWVGSYGHGLNLYDHKTNRFIYYKKNENDPNSMSGNRIYYIYEDRSGVIWVGTYNTGIVKFDPYNFSLTTNRNRPLDGTNYDHTDVRSFIHDRKGALWISTEGGGVSRTNADGSVDYFRHDPSNPYSLSQNEVMTVFEDSQGIVWLGTGNGVLHQYDRRRNRFIRYSSQVSDVDNIRHGRVRSIKEDRHGMLWVGVDGGGLHIFDRKTKTFKHYHHDDNDSSSLSNNRVFNIYEDAEGLLWIATFGGGFNLYNREADSFSHIRHDRNNSNSLIYDYVLMLTQDRDGLYWIGTDGKGINRYDRKNNQFTLYDESKGLSNNTIYGILEDDDGFLWMMHNKGLSRLDKQAETFKNYDVRDGIQSNEFNGGAYYKDSTGKLYFGGIEGYNAFYPKDIIENPFPPPIVITDFQLFNKTVSIGQESEGRKLLTNAITATDALVLSHKDYIFSFEFAALDFVLPSRNQYAYMMEGLVDSWNYVDDRNFVTYTTLPPGEYTFKVKASNNHGRWNEDGIALKITVTPPFWQTLWFRVIAVLVVILVVFLFYAARVKAIQARNKNLKEEVKRQTAELQSKTDELEVQKTSLEETLKELGETKDALIEAAHKAGMADTATGVLHNVGNILNSVNTSAGIIKEMLNRSVMDRYVKALKLIKDNLDNLGDFITNDPKGKKLVIYLLELEKPFKDENKEMKENTSRLVEKISAIREAIAAQQSTAKGHGLEEEMQLAELIEETLMLQSGSIGRHEIAVNKKIDPNMPNIKLQKAKVVQILLNLYKNAKESMDDNKNQENVLTIEVDHDNKNAYIRVSDTGMGIEKKKLQEIFAYGFSTKSDGHGFGLHSSANYMTEMGGSLWAESGGLGKGATFILKFPMRRRKTD